MTTGCRPCQGLERYGADPAPALTDRATNLSALRASTASSLERSNPIPSTFLHHGRTNTRHHFGMRARLLKRHCERLHKHEQSKRPMTQSTFTRPSSLRWSFRALGSLLYSSLLRISGFVLRLSRLPLSHQPFGNLQASALEPVGGSGHEKGRPFGRPLTYKAALTYSPA